MQQITIKIVGSIISNFKYKLILLNYNTVMLSKQKILCKQIKSNKINYFILVYFNLF